jgi:imidazolonepropionase-like amidohydrolase
MKRVLTPLFLLVAIGSCRSGPKDVVIALEGATLLDGAGGRPIDDALIVIRNGRFEAVARVNEIKVPKNAERVSLVGKTIVPGFIDAHVHVERWAVPRLLAWGVTAVRDMNDNADSALALKRDVNLGSILGPRIFSAGGMIDGAPATYPGATGVRTTEEARRAVDARAVGGAAGADFVKAYTGLTPELLRALVDEATSLRLRVAAHLGKTDALTAARAGVATLEHAAGVVQAAARNPSLYFRAHDRFLTGWTMEESNWAALDSVSLARVAKALAATRVAVVPTLALHDAMAHLADASHANPVGMDDVPANAASVRDVAGLLRRSGWKAPQFAAFQRSLPRISQFVREFKRAGGLVAAGSDAGNQLLPPGAALHREMALLVAAGFTPIEAITAATRRGAQAIGADSLGMIAPGRVADLVILHRSPLSDISATRDIDRVMIRGRFIAPDSLRAQWRAARP